MNQPGGQSENKKYTNSQELLKNELLAANPIPLMGVELPAVKPQKPAKSTNSEESDAKSDAHDAPKSPTDHDLDIVVKAWPELPEHIKAAVMALVETYTKTKTQE